MRYLLAALLSLVCLSAQAAITTTDRGTLYENTSATTATITPSGNFATGSWGVLVISADNSNTNGTAYSSWTVTDTNGNTWTRRLSPLYDPGAADAGVEGAVFTSPLTNGLDTGDTITITYGQANTMTLATLVEIVPTSGYTLSYVGGSSEAGSATASPTTTTSSIPTGDCVVGVLFNERGADQTITGDGDSSDGSWSTLHTTESTGTNGAGGMSVANQRKVVTGTNTQTFNPTLGVSSDVIPGWISLHETAPAGGNGPRSLLLSKRRRQ